MVKNFLGNRWTENYKELMEKLLKSLQDMGANMNVEKKMTFCATKRAHICLARKMSGGLKRKKEI